LREKGWGNGWEMQRKTLNDGSVSAAEIYSLPDKFMVCFLKQMEIVKHKT